MQQDTHETEVIFRVFKDGGDVIAMMPGIAGDMSPFTCASYQHIGQHGAADTAICRGNTRPASPDEYADLKRELEQIGYRVKVIKRMRREHLAQRKRQLHA